MPTTTTPTEQQPQQPTSYPLTDIIKAAIAKYADSVLNKAEQSYRRSRS